MDSIGQLQGNDALNQNQQKQTYSSSQGAWKQMGIEEKKAAVNEEIRRVNQLPTNSSYASHRLRVLNKIRQLLSIELLELWNYLHVKFVIVSTFIEASVMMS